MKGDALDGIRKGEKDARAQAKAKRAGAKAGRSSSGGYSKSKSLRAAGRSAVARAVRGAIAQKHKNGRGVRGLFNYMTDPKKSPEFVFSNCGDDPKTMLATMCRVVSLRPDIEKPVGHITLSLPPQVGQDETRWAEFIDELREVVGLDDGFPCCAVRHFDTDHSHAHLEYSRISVDGRVFDDWGIKYKCSIAAERIEQKFGLKLFPRDTQNQKNKLSKNEIELGVRTQQRPARLQIADSLKVAIQGRPTTAQFVERLQASGVGVRANISKTTGKMSGFSFSYDGIEFRASDVGKEYGWKNLSEVIDYDQNQIRDLEFLAGLNGGTGAAGADASRAVATIDGLDRAVAAVSSPTTDTRSNQVSGAPVINRTSELSGKAKQPATRPTQPAAQPTIAGFAKSENLDISLRSWAGNLTNRIGRPGRVAAQQQQRALLDARKRTIAISISGEYAIPEIKHLTDEQIVSLLQDLGGETKISGTPDFCQRVEEVASKNGLQVTHEYQVSETERKAADARIASRQREELLQRSANSPLPGYAPK